MYHLFGAACLKGRVEAEVTAGSAEVLVGDGEGICKVKDKPGEVRSRVECPGVGGFAIKNREARSALHPGQKEGSRDVGQQRLRPSWGSMPWRA